MAEQRKMTPVELVDKGDEQRARRFRRESMAWVAAELLEAEVAGLVGAALGEVSPERATRRNGYRSRAWDTRAGEIELRIPKLRSGSYFPSFLGPRRRAPSRRWWRSCRRPTSTASRPARSTGSSSSSGSRA
jgi:transposase-like protein